MIRLIYSLTYLNARSAWRGLKGGRVTGWWRSDDSVAVGVYLNELTSIDRSTLRLFSIPSSIADNSLLRFPWGDTVGTPRPAIFTSDARKRKTTRHENSGELAPILNLPFQELLLLLKKNTN